MHDVVIAGSGPAGTALAAACGEAGLDTLVLAGTDDSWKANYGGWIDTFEQLGFGAYFSKSWSQSQVVFGPRNVRTLDRPYGRVDRDALREALRARCRAGGVTWQPVLCTSVSHDARGGHVVDADGNTHHGTVVVDATGFRPALVETAGEPTMWQAAFGIEGQCAHGTDPDCMTFMDFRTPEGSSEDVPTFLYAMPLGTDRIFLEETSLIRGPAVAFVELEARWKARMESMGFHLTTHDEVERCLIPMDIPIPDMHQRTVAFGGAAGMVHPATGYLLPQVLEAAPRVAGAIRGALMGSTDPDRAARAAWGEVWRRSDLIRRELFLYGARIVSEMNAHETRAFFGAFFRTPDAMWRGYLGDANVSLILRAMLSSFGQSDARTRWLLARSGIALPVALGRQVLA